MDSDSIFAILAVVLVAILKVLPAFLKFKREHSHSHAEPSESMREILDSLKRGEARQVVITRDDGKPVHAEELSEEELLAALEDAENVEESEVPEPPEAPAYDASRDAALLEAQQRYAALAAQAEASLAARTPESYEVADTDEEAQADGDFAARLPELVRSRARDAVALSIIFAPPPGLAK